MSDSAIMQVRKSLEDHGWFTVIDALVHLAEQDGHKQIAKDLDRVGETIIRDIEHLGGTPKVAR